MNCCTHDNVLPGVARVAASSLWKEKPDFNYVRLFAVTRSFNVLLLGEGALCCCCARPSSRVTNKAGRMPLPFRGAHAPAVQGADAACVGGARGGRVSGAHEQQATVDGRLHASLQPSRPICDFAKCGCTVPANSRCPPSSHFFIVIWFHLIFSAKVRGERKKLSKKFVPTF